MALVLLQDRIREDAKATLDYFKEQDVTLKIISGDNPATVATVARRVGLHDYENHIDSRTLPEDPEALEEIMENNTILVGLHRSRKKKCTSPSTKRSYCWDDW